MEKGKTMSKYIKLESLKWHSPDESIAKPLTEFYITESDIADLPTIEVSEDCIDRYSALAELDPRSYEYKAVKELPSVIPKTQIETQNSNENSNDISVSDGVSEMIRCAMCNNPNQSYKGCDGACSYDEKLYKRIMDAINASRVEVSEDCISREYLKSFGYINKGDFNSVETIREWIDNAPSVVPKERIEE